MKVYINKTVFLPALAFAGLLLAGCSKDFLTEKSVSKQTADSYFVTAQGFEDLVKSCYPLLRDIHQQRNLVLNGTDIFTSGDWGGAGKPGATADPLDVYDVNLNSSASDISMHWNTLYQEIGRTNAAIQQAKKVEELSDSLKTIRVGEAKFLRSLCFFYAVQQWGDIPMPLLPSASPNKNIIRVPSADVYKQIIADLQECEANLPLKQKEYGRITKGAAQFLLSRVYLTRGWNFNNVLGGTNADFTEALKYADKVIAAYPLQSDYRLLWPQHSENPTLETFTAATSVANDKDPEIIFSVQYSGNTVTNGTGNNLHSLFGGEADGIPGALTRSSAYNRFQSKHVATAAMYRLYDPQLDIRYEWNFVDAMIALKDVPSFVPRTGAGPISFATGDTVTLFRPWNDPALSVAERGMDVAGGTKKYAVINTDEFASREDFGTYNANHPLMFKFWQPGIPYGDAEGTGNEAIFRVAEAYLIAAEAIVKGATGGTLGGAHVYYNKVLDRALGANAGADPHCAADPGDVSSLAAVSYRATPSNITVDMILDERARELMGEYSRWFDLKRTGKLIERTKKYNPWTKAKAGADFDADDYLRPIPQDEIDLSFPRIEQNEGY